MAWNKPYQRLEGQKDGLYVSKIALLFIYQEYQNNDNKYVVPIGCFSAVFRCN